MNDQEVAIENTGNAVENEIEIVKEIANVNVIEIGTGSVIIVKLIPERDHVAETVSVNVIANVNIEREAERRLQHIHLPGRE